MTAHPGQTLSIYDLPAICQLAWDRAANPVTVKNGFRCTGISPFDRNIFQDDDFLGAYVTDRPEPTEEPAGSNAVKECESVVPDRGGRSSIPEEEIARVNNSQNMQEADRANEPIIKSGSLKSPQEIRPFPKAGARKEAKKKGRKKGRCMIATDTPEKDELAAKKIRGNPKTPAVADLRRVKKKVLPDSSSSESEPDVEMTEAESSGGEWECNSEKSEDDFRSLSIGTFVVVKVFGKKAINVRNYVARIQDTCLDGYSVKFFKKQIQSNRFIESQEDEAFVTYAEVVVKLPTPMKDTRARFLNMTYFNVDLSEYSLQ